MSAVVAGNYKITKSINYSLNGRTYQYAGTSFKRVLDGRHLSFSVHFTELIKNINLFL